MITRYVECAMQHARHEVLSDGTHHAEIPECPGVWATGATRGKCLEELREVLEEWLLLRLHDGDPLPEIEGLDLNRKAV